MAAAEILAFGLAIAVAEEDPALDDLFCKVSFKYPVLYLKQSAANIINKF